MGLLHVKSEVLFGTFAEQKLCKVSLVGSEVNFRKLSDWQVEKKQRA